MNSALRAHQVPTYTEAHAWRRPSGNTEPRTIVASPPFRHQKETASGASVHAAPGRSARRQKSMSPMPSMPYTPKRAVWPWTGVVAPPGVRPLGGQRPQRRVGRPLPLSSRTWNPPLPHWMMLRQA